jgi:P-type E1-E2 ATPase
MISLNIPGKGTYQIEHVVFDVNGTLALDGQLLDGIPQRIHKLQEQVKVHLITANTHGKQDTIDNVLGFHAELLSAGNEAKQKAEFVKKLNADTVVAIGQGANDVDMLRVAALGIGILSNEGIARETLLAADLLVPNIDAAFDCLANPRRIVASLRR